MESGPQSEYMFLPSRAECSHPSAPLSPGEGHRICTGGGWAPEAPVVTPTSRVASPLLASTPTSVKWGCNVHLPKHLKVALGITTGPFSLLPCASVISSQSSQHPARWVGGLFSLILQMRKRRPRKVRRQPSCDENPVAALLAPQTLSSPSSPMV